MIPNSALEYESSVQRREVFAAPRTRVFAAWTEAAILKKWWGPPGSVTQAVTIDLRLGGQYRFTMQFPPKEVFHIYGVYREIRPLEKLVFTWECDRADLDYGETIVTIEFFDMVSSTEVVLTHERVVTPDAKEHFGLGWDKEFNKLREFLAVPEFLRKE